MRFTLYVTLLLCVLPLVFSRPFFGLCVYYIVAFLQPKLLCWRPDFQDSLLVGVPLVFGAIVLGVHRPRWRFAADGLPTDGAEPALREELSRAPLFHPSWQVLLLIALVGYIGLIRLVTPFDASESSEQFNRLCKVALVAALTTGLAASADRLRALCMVVALAAGFWAVKAGIWTLMLGAHRTYGEDYDNNLFALKSVMVLPLLFHMGIISKDRRVRGLLLGLALCACLGIIGSRSRAGFAALAFVLVGMLWSSRRSPRTAGAILLLGFVGLCVSGSEIWARWEGIRRYGEDRSAGKRFAIWSDAWEVFEVNPLTGVGFANFERAHAKEYQASWAAHNIWLQNLVELGLIGHPLWLCLVWGTIGSLFLSMRRARRGPPELRWLEQIARALFMGMVAFWIHGMFHNEEYLELMFAFIGLSVCVSVVLHHESLRPAAAAVPMRTKRSATPAEETPGWSLPLVFGRTAR